MRLAGHAVVKSVARDVGIVSSERLGAGFSGVLVIDCARDDVVVHLLGGSAPVGDIDVVVDIGCGQRYQAAQGGYGQATGS